MVVVHLQSMNQLLHEALKLASIQYFLIEVVTVEVFSVDAYAVVLAALG